MESKNKNNGGGIGFFRCVASCIHRDESSGCDSLELDCCIFTGNYLRGTCNHYLHNRSLLTQQ